jgi:hypothetical protein
MLTPGTPVCFMYKKGQQAIWNSGFVSETLDHFVHVRRQPGSRGAVLKVAYEDIRVKPRSKLLQDLDKFEEEGSSINSDSNGNTAREISHSDEHPTRLSSDWIYEGSIWISQRSLTTTQETPAREVTLEMKPLELFLLFLHLLNFCWLLRC